MAHHISHRSGIRVKLIIASILVGTLSISYSNCSKFKRHKTGSKFNEINLTTDPNGLQISPNSGNGFNNYFIHQYILEENIKKYGNENCLGCPSNMWPKSYDSIVKAMNVLKDTSIHHFREGLSFSVIFPNFPIPEKHIVEHIVRILKLYQDHNATVILVFGSPLPQWMNNDAGKTPPYTAIGWCPMPVEDIDWSYANTYMSQSIAALGEALWNDPRLNKDWLRKQLLIEPYNEFDSLNTYLVKEQTCGGYLPILQSGKRAAEFSNKIINNLTKMNVPIPVIMPSGVFGNTDYFKSFYENGGTGPANAHLYPEYTSGVDHSSVSAVTSYRAGLIAGLRAINNVIPEIYKNMIILGEFGLADERIGVCEQQQVGSDSSTTWPGRVIKGQASDRFLTEIFQDQELASLTSMRMKWMYVDGGYIDKEDSNDPNKGKGTGCNRTNGALTKDLNPKFQLYNYLLEVDKFRWEKLPLVGFIEYKSIDPSLKHNVGFSEGDSWSTTVNDQPGYMIYGPYVSNLPETTFAVVFDVVVDNNSADNANVLGLDVFDSTSGETLAGRSYTRTEMATPLDVAELSLSFSLDGRENHQIEFRAYAFGVSYVKINRIRVASHSFETQKLSQTINFPQPQDGTVGKSITLSASATSGLPVSYISNNGNCTVSGNTVNPIIAGSCSITAAQSGNAQYNPAPNVSKIFQIAPLAPQKLSQTINFPQPQDGTVGKSITLSASATSGLPVSYISNSGNCTVSGNTVNPIIAGSCSITAAQSGNAQYNPAPNVSKIFQIAPLIIEYTGNSSKLSHKIGRAEQNSWSVTVNDKIGYMVYGPYVTDLPKSATKVIFDVVVDNNSADNAPLVALEVFDFTSNKFLALTQYGRQEMAAPFQVGRFELPISMAGHENHQIEFRVLALGISYIKINRIQVIVPSL